LPARRCGRFIRYGERRVANRHWRLPPHSPTIASSSWNPFRPCAIAANGKARKFAEILGKLFFASILIKLIENFPRILLDYEQKASDRANSVFSGRC